MSADSNHLNLSLKPGSSQIQLHPHSQKFSFFFPITTFSSLNQVIVGLPFINRCWPANVPHHLCLSISLRLELNPTLTPVLALLDQSINLESWCIWIQDSLSLSGMHP